MVGSAVDNRTTLVHRDSGRKGTRTFIIRSRAISQGRIGAHLYAVKCRISVGRAISQRTSSINAATGHPVEEGGAINQCRTSERLDAVSPGVVVSRAIGQ